MSDARSKATSAAVGFRIAKWFPDNCSSEHLIDASMTDAKLSLFPASLLFTLVVQPAKIDGRQQLKRCQNSVNTPMISAFMTRALPEDEDSD